MDLRDEIIKKLKKSSSEDIFITISDAITSQNDITLPGLGVLFELFWNQQNNADKQIICKKLSKMLQ